MKCKWCDRPIYAERDPIDRKWCWVHRNGQVVCKPGKHDSEERYEALWMKTAEPKTHPAWEKWNA